MEKCILCNSKIKRREIDYELFFDKTQHIEYNVNIIATGDVTYVEIRNSEGYDDFWHIHELNPAPTKENVTSLTHRLNEKIAEVLEEE